MSEHQTSQNAPEQIVRLFAEFGPDAPETVARIREIDDDLATIVEAALQNFVV